MLFIGSLVVVAAGLAAAFGVGDGTRCGAALCHSFARFVLALRRKSYHARLVDPRLKLHTKIILRNLKTRYRWFSKEGLKFGTTTQIRPWNNSVWLFCVMFISSGYASVSLAKARLACHIFVFFVAQYVRLECVEYAILITVKSIYYTVYRTCLVWTGPAGGGYDFVAIR